MLNKISLFFLKSSGYYIITKIQFFIFPFLFSSSMNRRRQPAVFALSGRPDSQFVHTAELFVTALTRSVSLHIRYRRFFTVCRDRQPIRAHCRAIRCCPNPLGIVPYTISAVFYCLWKILSNFLQLNIYLTQSHFFS